MISGIHIIGKVNLSIFSLLVVGIGLGMRLPTLTANTIVAIDSICYYLLKSAE
jgi:hypothetical protein